MRRVALASRRGASLCEAVVERVIERYLRPGVANLAPGLPHWTLPAALLAQTPPELSDSKYGACHGEAALLEALGEKVEAENRICMRRHQLVITPGANQGFMHALLATIDVGDTVIVFAPFYFSHLAAISLAGGVPRVLPTDPDGHPSLDALRAALRAEGNRGERTFGERDYGSKKRISDIWGKGCLTYGRNRVWQKKSKTQKASLWLAYASNCILASGEIGCVRHMGEMDDGWRNKKTLLQK